MGRSRKRCPTKKQLEIRRMPDFTGQSHRLPVKIVINSSHLVNFSLYNMNCRIEAHRRIPIRETQTFIIGKLENLVNKGEIRRRLGLVLNKSGL